MKDTYFIDEFIIISEEGTEQYKKFLKNERENLLRRIHPSKEILEDDAAKKKFPRMSKENLLARVMMPSQEMLEDTTNYYKRSCKPLSETREPGLEGSQLGLPWALPSPSLPTQSLPSTT